MISIISAIKDSKLLIIIKEVKVHHLRFLEKDLVLIGKEVILLLDKEIAFNLNLKKAHLKKSHIVELDQIGHLHKNKSK